MTFDEPKLLKELRSGDRRAFRKLVEKTQDNVYNTCFSFVKNKQDAEDIAQQVYIEVHKNISKFREDAKLSTWMYRIAVNRSLNHIKSKKRHQQVHSLDEMMASEHIRELPAVDNSTDDNEFEYKRKIAILQMAIETLPENQKIAVNLNKFEHLPYQEVAEIMGMSLSAVSALLNRAKISLQKKVKLLYEKHE